MKATFSLLSNAAKYGVRAAIRIEDDGPYAIALIIDWNTHNKCLQAQRWVDAATYFLAALAIETGLGLNVPIYPDLSCHGSANGAWRTTKIRAEVDRQSDRIAVTEVFKLVAGLPS